MLLWWAVLIPEHEYFCCSIRIHLPLFFLSVQTYGFLPRDKRSLLYLWSHFGTVQPLSTISDSEMQDKIPQPAHIVTLPFLTLSRWAQSWLQTPSWLSTEISQQLLQGIPHIKILLLLFWLIFWLDIQNWFHQISSQKPFSSSLITYLFLTSLLRRESGFFSSWRWSYAISTLSLQLLSGQIDHKIYHQPGTQLSLCCHQSTRLKIEPPEWSWKDEKLQRGIDWYPNIWILFILSLSFKVQSTDSPLTTPSWCCFDSENS